MREIRGTHVLVWLLAGLSVASLAVNVVQNRQLKQLRTEPPSTASDQRYIDSAIQLWSAHIRRPPEHAVEGRFAKVMYIGEEVCVSLEINVGGVGGTPVYCFRGNDGKLTRRYDKVQ